MSAAPKISLIVSTLGRVEELKFFFESLLLQTIVKDCFEVIIVDQNDDHCIDSLVMSYSDRLNIRHIYSAVKGLSYCRNLGLKHSVGLYCCVPDDDCTYYPDTLQRVCEKLDEFGHPDMLIGRVFDRESQQHVFKKTPDKSIIVDRYNFYRLVSSITLFFKRDIGVFDEQFGVGALYPSNEDGDFILMCLNDKRRIIYSPAIVCNHPPYNAATMSEDKLFRYGIGFGAMCRKHLSIPIVTLFIKGICYQSAMLIVNLLSFRGQDAKRRKSALLGRLKGFVSYSG